MVVISKKSQSGSSSQNHIIFEDENPNSKSYASLILLNDELRYQDKDFLEDDFWVYLEFREKYLLSQKEKNGDLICTYCGKPHLEIGSKEPKKLVLNNRNKNLATIDHIEPISGGGARYDENNLCVSCKKCNKEKGAMSLEEYMLFKKRKLMKQKEVICV